MLELEPPPCHGRHTDVNDKATRRGLGIKRAGIDWIQCLAWTQVRLLHIQEEPSRRG